MSEFKKYQHLERFGTPAVNGIEIGMCYVFPKLDGTNGSIWFDGSKLCAGSRNRELSIENDNAGFLRDISLEKKYFQLVEDFQDVIFYGEWLVPHTLRTYQDDAWRDFYVFDAVKDGEYLEYEVYKEMLDCYNVNYIPPIVKIKNPTDETLNACLDKNIYLIKDNEGVGEGIVIKNYGFVNRFKHTIWAKIVRNEFKVKNQKVFGPSEIKEKQTPEEHIVSEFVTGSLVEKEFAKIDNDEGWTSRKIPKLLNIVYYCLVKEECWNFVKKHKNPTINFKRLMGLTFAKVKEIKPELF